MRYWLEDNSGTCLHHWHLSTFGQVKSSKVSLDWPNQFRIHQNPAGVLRVVRGSSLLRPGFIILEVPQGRPKQQQKYICGRDMPLPNASWFDVSMIYFRNEDFVKLAALFLLIMLRSSPIPVILQVPTRE